MDDCNLNMSIILFAFDFPLEVIDISSILDISFFPSVIVIKINIPPDTNSNQRSIDPKLPERKIITCCTLASVNAWGQFQYFLTWTRENGTTTIPSRISANARDAGKKKIIILNLHFSLEENKIQNV